MTTPNSSTSPNEQCHWLSIITPPTKNGVYLVQFPQPPYTGVCLWDLEDWWLIDNWLLPGFTTEITHWSILPNHWQDHGTLVFTILTLPSDKEFNSRLARPILANSERAFQRFVDNAWYKEGHQLPQKDGVYLRTKWSGIYPVLWSEGQWSTLNTFQEISNSKPGAHWAYLPSTIEEYEALFVAAMDLDRPPPPQEMWELM